MRQNSSQQPEEEESDILGDFGVKKVRETMKRRAKAKKKTAANSEPASPHLSNLDDSLDDPTFNPSGPGNAASAVTDDVSANDQVRVLLISDLASAACLMLPKWLFKHNHVIDNIQGELYWLKVFIALIYVLL